MFFADNGMSGRCTVVQFGFMVVVRMSVDWRILALSNLYIPHSVFGEESDALKRTCISAVETRGLSVQSQIGS